MTKREVKKLEYFTVGKGRRYYKKSIFRGSKVVILGETNEFGDFMFRETYYSDIDYAIKTEKEEN